MSLRSITIENFQSLKKVSLTPGALTVVLGESDLGKSALFRAIHAAVTNQTGQEFVRYGEKEVQVTLDVGDKVVSWTKGASASYRVWTRGNSIEPPAVFDKVRGVPEQIEEALNMGVVVCGDTSIDPSFHQQFDTPFLVADTASTRAKVIGELSGINMLFIATQEARRLEQAAKARDKQRTADVEKQREALRRYDGLETRGRQLDDAMTALRNTGEYDAQVESLTLLIEHLRRTAQRLDVVTKRMSVLRLGLARFDAVPAPDGAADALAALLEAMRHGARRAQDASAATSAKREALASVEAALADVKICPSCGQVIQAEEVVV